MDIIGNEYKRCYYCGEKIQAYARRCDYCGSLLKSELNGIYYPAYSDRLEESEESADQLKEPDESNEINNLDINNNDNLDINNNLDIKNNINNEISEDKKIKQFNDAKAGRLGNTPDPNLRFLPGTYSKNKLSNGLKVFITVITSVIPGLGQLLGVILSIVFINADDHDMRSFGTALLVSSMILFIITCILFFIILLAAYSMQQM